MASLSLLSSDWYKKTFLGSLAVDNIGMCHQVKGVIEEWVEENLLIILSIFVVGACLIGGSFYAGTGTDWTPCSAWSVVSTC
jgi:hypothetical protein